MSERVQDKMPASPAAANRAVCHVIYLSEKPGQNPFSGAENHIMTLLAGLAARAIDTELIVLLWHSGPIIDARLKELRAAGVRVCIVPRPFSSVLGRVGCALVVWRGLTRLLRERREHIVHLHLDLVACPIAAMLAGCRHIVISVHNDEQYYARAHWRFWLRRLARRTAHFIAITQHVADYFARCAGLSATDITVIRYGVPRPVPQPDARQALGLMAGDFAVGFVGRLVPQKDVETLLRAMADVPAATCVLIGEGPERPALEALTRALSLEGRVRFFGALADAGNYMHALDVFCLPSRWEGLGLVLVEAMLQKVPVVASRAGAIPEVMDDGRSGWLCEQGNAAEFARAIQEIRADRAKTAALVERAFAYAVNRFDIAAMLDRTIAVYRRGDL